VDDLLYRLLYLDLLQELRASLAVLPYLHAVLLQSNELQGREEVLRCSAQQP
jgi:hypothetical protein